MTAADAASKLNALLKELEESAGAGVAAPLCPDPALIDPGEPVLAEFLRSFLIWEAGSCAAHEAIKRIARRIVDLNELRVCLPDEIVSILGAGYPRAGERALRLRAALTELFLREHAVTLEPITKMSKRDAIAYLDSLEGVPHFVSARVGLLCLGVHAAPVDSRILRRLVERGIVAADAAPEGAASALERKVHAGEMARAYTLLQRWADALPLDLADPLAAEASGEDPAPRRSGASRAQGNGDVEKTQVARSPKPRKPRKKQG